MLVTNDGGNIEIEYSTLDGGKDKGVVTNYGEGGLQNGKGGGT